MTKPGFYTPDMSAMLKVNEQAVDMYSGTIGSTIPIYTIQLGNLPIPITMTYQSGGIRVAEVASNVGLGWNLSFGGAVTRSIRGLDDLLQNTLYNVEYAKSLSTQSSSVLEFCPQLSDRDQYFANQLTFQRLDTEFDLFFFNLPGKSQKFMQFMDGTYRTLPLTDFKIERLGTANGTYWRITNEDGFKFYFGSDSVRTLPASSIDVTATSTSNNAGGSSYSSEVSGWHLLRIVSPQGRTIEYEYEETRYKYQASKYQNYLFQTGETPTSLVTGDVYNDYYSQRIKKIIFPEGVISFEYGNERKDVQRFSGSTYVAGSEPKYLNKIVIRNKDGQHIKSCEFSYKYFFQTGTKDESQVSTSGQNYLNYRLKLEKLSFKDTLNKAEDYLFQYEENVNLPNRLSPETDFWGYYNHNSSQSYLPSLLAYPYYSGSGQFITEMCNTSPRSILSDYFHITYAGADKDADPQYAKANILKSVQYPTGGIVKFNYEGNKIRYYRNFHVTNPANVRQSVMATNFEGDTVSNEFYFNPSENIYYSPGSSVSYDISVGDNDFANNVFAIRFIRLDNNSFFDVTSMNGETSGSVSLVPQKSYRVMIVPWGNNVYSSFFCSVEISWVTPNTQTSDEGSFNKTVGGLRIADVKYYSGENELAKTTEYRYDEVVNDSLRSSGDLIEYPDFVTLGSYFDGTETVIGCSLNSQTSSVFLSPSSSHVGYDKVTKLERSISGNDSLVSEYYFSSRQLEAAEYVNNPVAAPYDFPDWQRGLLAREVHFANSGTELKPIKEVMYSYKFEGLNDGPSIANENFATTMVNQEIGYRYYKLTNERMWMDSSVTMDYAYKNNLGSFLQNQVFYFYDNATYLQPSRIETVNSKGERIKKHFKYPYDFTSAICQQMVNQNLLTNVVEETESKIVNSSPTELRKTLTDYANWQSNAFILPTEVKTSLNANTLQTETLLQSYDSKGNILQLIEKDGILTSILWDYNQSYPIAEVRNAQASDIAYTSFEADGTGGWSGITGANVQTSGGVTGSRYFQKSGFSLSKTGLSASTDYNASYWSNAGSFAITGTQAGYPKSLATISVGGISWTLYEHLISGQTSVSITGSGGIDELRLHPAKAEMKTYTYKPLVGISCQADAGNHLSFFEYDSFNRLCIIRDQDGNAIKKYEYHNSGQ